MELTLEEQAFAEKHLDLVDRFLWSRRLDPDEFYDIVIFGFLGAVQYHCRGPFDREDPRFIGLAFTFMQKRADSEYRRQYRKQKNLGTQLSMDSSYGEEDDESMHDAIPGRKDWDPDSCSIAKDMFDRAFEASSEKGKRVISLKMRGLETGEISRLLGIGERTVNYHIQQFNARITAICDGIPFTSINTSAYEKNRDAIRARNSAYQKANRDKVNAARRARRAANREEFNAKRREKRAEKKRLAQCAEGSNTGGS